LREARPAVYFATQNKGKFREATRIAESFQIDLRHLNTEKREIQASKLSEIACHAALQAARSTNRRVVADDSGFFVKALNGFPGPYSSYVFDTIGLEGILKLLKAARNREAYFKAAVAYCTPGHLPVCFSGVVRGLVTERRRGTRGFGYDPIFVPLGSAGKTFAEMGIDEKNMYSHRARAFTAFCKWLTSRPRSRQS
jgi:XTP/dITP diphosphohydrolase